MSCYMSAAAMAADGIFTDAKKATKRHHRIGDVPALFVQHHIVD